MASSSMQRRIQRLEKQAQQKSRDQGGFSRASATLLVDILHMNEDLSSEEREAAIQEQMEFKPGPPPSPEWKQKVKEVVYCMTHDDGKPFQQAMAELKAMSKQ